MIVGINFANNTWIQWIQVVTTLKTYRYGKDNSWMYDVHYLPPTGYNGTNGTEVVAFTGSSTGNGTLT